MIDDAEPTDDAGEELRSRRCKQVDSATELYANLRRCEDSHLRLNAALLRDKFAEIREWNSDFIRPFVSSSEMLSWKCDYGKILSYVDRNCVICRPMYGAAKEHCSHVKDVVAVALDRDKKREIGATADTFGKQLGSSTMRRRLVSIAPGADRRASAELVRINRELSEIGERLRSAVHRMTYDEGRVFIWLRCNQKGPSVRRYLLREW